MNLHMFNEYPV